MLIQQSEDNVMEAVLQCLDKADMMLEYVGYGNDALDEYVSEMFELFMEATARRKKADEIDEYMRKHNLGDVNSKNPNKAKTARSMRNFLIMHDFDPKTGTVKSTDGKRRIQLQFNSDNSFHRGDMSGIDLIALEKDIKKAHQADKHFIMNHEKGHEHFAHDGSATKWNDQLNENERGIKHIKAAKEAGKKISSHDDGSYITRGGHDSPEELEADLHGFKNTRIRTKYAGRKRAVKRSGATRSVTDKEIEKVFVTMDKFAEKPFFDPSLTKDLKEMRSALIKIRDAYSSVCEILRNGQISKKCSAAGDLSKATGDFSLYLRKTELRDISFIIEDYYRSLNKVDRLLYAIKRIKSKTELSEEDERELSRISNLLESYQKKVNDIKEHYGDRGIGETDGDRTIKLIHDYYHLLNIYEDRDKKEYNEALTKFLNDKTKNIQMMDTMINVIGDITSPEYLRKQLKDALKEWKTNMVKHKMHDSTQMRHDFVKKYVHECFEEFMLDYYSYENVFGVYMED